MRGIKLTRNQRQVVMKHNLDPYQYELLKFFKNGWLIRNMNTNETCVVYPDKKEIFCSDGVTLLSEATHT